MFRDASLLSVLTLASVALSCSSSMNCTDVGCPSSMTMNVPVVISYSDVRASTLTVCRNDDCFTGPLSGLPPTLLDHTGMGVLIPAVADADARSRCFVSVWSPPRIDVRCDSAGPQAVMDGDRYRLTLTDATGAVVASVDRTVSYAVSFPNGEECGPTCHSTTIDLGTP
jgi:hypothetical protein